MDHDRANHVLFHQAALGDFLLALPLVTVLPGRWTVVSHWSHAHLASRLIPGTRAMDIEMFEFTRLWAAGGPTRVSPAVGELLGSADTVLSFVSGGDDAWARNVARLAPRARLACAGIRPPSDWTDHVTLWQRRQLAQAGLELPEPPVTALVSGAVEAGGPLLVHPGAGGPGKAWPRARHEALLQAATAHGWPTRVVLGEAERATWPPDELARWQAQHGAEVCATPDRLVEATRSAGAYVGSDAGPTHLAARLGVPTVALFGPTDPRVWRPLGPRVTVLAPPEPGPMDWLTVERVLAALPRRG